MAKNKGEEDSLKVIVAVGLLFVIILIGILIYPTIENWLAGLGAWMETHLFNIPWQ